MKITQKPSSQHRTVPSWPWSSTNIVPNAVTLVSKVSTSVSMVEQVEVEHFKSKTEGNADEELYVVVQEDAWQEEWSRIFQIVGVLAEMISVRNG